MFLEESEPSEGGSSYNALPQPGQHHQRGTNRFTPLIEKVLTRKNVFILDLKPARWLDLNRIIRLSDIL